MSKDQKKWIGTTTIVLLVLTGICGVAMFWWPNPFVQILGGMLFCGLATFALVRYASGNT